MQFYPEQDGSSRESKNNSLYQIPKRWWHLQSRMAGIIAQLTRAARERSAKRTYGTNKCMWVEETCTMYIVHCTFTLYIFIEQFTLKLYIFIEQFTLKNLHHTFTLYKIQNHSRTLYLLSSDKIFPGTLCTLLTPASTPSSTTGTPSTRRGGRSRWGRISTISSRATTRDLSTKVRIVRAEEQEVMVAWREHKAALAEERRGRRSPLLPASQF